MSKHRVSIDRATAAMMEIISCAQQTQAAILRGEGQEELEAIRARAHDHLDTYIDHTAEAATAVKALAR
jgi:hypothetical protein